MAQNACMFIRAKKRLKDGKVHRYWSVVENKRLSSGRVVQKQVVYWGELNDRPRAEWIKAIEGRTQRAKQLALFPSEASDLPANSCEIARIRLKEMSVQRPASECRDLQLRAKQEEITAASQSRRPVFTAVEFPRKQSAAGVEKISTAHAYRTGFQ